MQVSPRPHLVAFRVSDAELAALDSLMRAERTNRSAVLRALVCDVAGVDVETGEDAPRHYLTPTTEAAMRRDWELWRESSYALAERWNVSQTSVAVRIRAWRGESGE
jgi:hypothetical protein